MLPETHPLIEKVTEPLSANAERRLAAKAFLGEKFDSAHPGVAEATARLEAMGRRRFPKLRKALPWFLAALAFVAAVSPWVRSIYRALPYHVMQNFNNDFSGFLPVLPAGLTEEQRLLLPDPRVGVLEQKRRLHIHAPENPAYFAEYARRFSYEKGDFAPDFSETAARIAPENAYFTYFAAGGMGGESVTDKTRGVSRSVRGEVEFDITDPAAFEKALAFIAKAAAMPDFETYTNPMIVARMRLRQRPAETIPEFMSAMAGADDIWFEIYQLQRVADLLSARAEQLSKSGRKEEFLALAAQREALVAHLGRNPDINSDGEQLYSQIAISTVKNFEIAADRLSLAEMAETYRKQGEAFQKEEDMRSLRWSKEGNPFREDKVSTFHRFLDISEVNSPPPVSDADFEPMRRAEHELLGGIGILALALSLPVAALLVFLFRFLSTPMIRIPAKRMAGVLGMADWAWVTGLGIVLPILFFLIVTRFTSLAGREYGVMCFEMVFPGVQYAALLLALLIAPAIAVRWRLGKQLAFFGFGDRFTVLLAIAALAMIAVWSLAALPLVERFGMEDHHVLADLSHSMNLGMDNSFTLTALASPVTLCLGLLFLNALRSILGKPAARLAQCTTVIAVLPAYPIAIILLCALTPIYSAGEKRWLAKETLLRIDPDAPDLGAYEFKVAAQKRKEINAITSVE